MLGQYDSLRRNLARPPGFTTLRCNTLHGIPEDILTAVKNELTKRHPDVVFDVSLHPLLADLIVITNQGPVDRPKLEKEVIVDRFCGMAVLRGSDVFASGLLAMSPNICEGDCVSLYVDIDGVCLRGSLPPYKFTRAHVGNGVARYSRREVFCGSKSLSGIGIEVAEPLYISPKLNDFLPSLVFAQNLPSCLCAHVLNPQPGEMILDMCAAPGGKTSHIGSLMKNSGTLIAMDKAKRKILTVKENLERAGCTISQVHCYDSTKAALDIRDGSSRSLATDPPYPAGSFDRILLDAPCSALGQRPALSNHMSSKELSSYPPLQRKLLSTAVRLLKPGGVLVYSTCTFVAAENEDQIDWLIREHPEMSIQPQGIFHVNKILLSPHSTLAESQLSMLQSFHPAFLSADPQLRNCDNDTIGFFIAKLQKDLNS